MAQDLAEYDEQGGAVAEVGQSGGLLAQIVAAASDPAVDAGKMTAMADLAIKLQDREHEHQFNRDFNAAVMEMPVITKTGRILIPGKGSEPDRVQGTYARFEDLNRIVKPILIKHNLSITFEVGGNDARITVAPIISHRNGMTRKWPPLPLPLETSGSKNNVQGVGSSISYGKRYAMCAALNISVESEDDDGSGGGRVMPEERGNLVIEEATAAADDGRYAEWFRAQSPKDRAWLVSQGHHARLGGAAIADQRQPVQGEGSAETYRKAAEIAAGPPPEQTEPSEADNAKAWTARYIDRVKACTSLDALAALQEKSKEQIAKIRADYPALWPEITEAQGGTYDRLSGAGNQDDSTGGLFEGGGK